MKIKTNNESQNEKMIEVANRLNDIKKDMGIGRMSLDNMNWMVLTIEQFMEETK